MTKTINTLTKLILPLSLLVGGCASDPPTRYYDLYASDRLAVDVSNQEAKNTATSFGVGPIQVPRALEQIGIVTRQGDNLLGVSTYYVWAGGLSDSIAKVLADNLTTISGNPRIWTYPWDNRTRPEHQIRLVIEEFGGSLGGEVTLRAKWTLLSEHGKEERMTRRVSFRQQTLSDDYSAYVAAMNEILNELSAQLYQKIWDTLANE